METMRNQYALGKRAKIESILRKLRPQTGCGIRASNPEIGRGERKSDLVSERRSGAGDPLQFQQSLTSGGGKARMAGHLHGAEPLQVAAAIFLFAGLLAGCSSRHRQAQSNVPPPPVTEAKTGA